MHQIEVAGDARAHHTDAAQIFQLDRATVCTQPPNKRSVHTTLHITFVGMRRIIARIGGIRTGTGDGYPAAIDGACAAGVEDCSIPERYRSTRPRFQD